MWLFDLERGATLNMSLVAVGNVPFDCSRLSVTPLACSHVFKDDAFENTDENPDEDERPQEVKLLHFELVATGKKKVSYLLFLFLSGKFIGLWVPGGSWIKAHQARR